MPSLPQAHTFSISREPRTQSPVPRTPGVLPGASIRSMVSVGGEWHGVAQS